MAVPLKLEQFLARRFGATLTEGRLEALSAQSRLRTVVNYLQVVYFVVLVVGNTKPAGEQTDREFNHVVATASGCRF